jgi:hypothetical protein
MAGLSFLSPLFLIGAIAAAIPILLHLFHRKTEVVVEFPAVRLLTRVPVQQHRRRQLRELILLALRVIAVVLLALSFARPYFAGAAAPESAPVTVIAVDTSMSMRAPGQFDRARDAATRAATAAQASSALALIAFADAATVVVEPTTDRGAITSAIAQLMPGSGGTRYRSALARANEMIGTRDAKLVVVTDLQQAGWESNDDGGLAEGVSVDVMAIAPPVSNVAITNADRHDRRIAATLQSYASNDVKTAVHLIADGKEVAASDVTLAPMGAATVELNASLPTNGTAEVRVDDPTGYQGDNVRRVALETTPAIPIMVVVADPTGSTGGLYLERALNVAGAGKEFSVTVRDGREVATLNADDMSKQGAVFIAGTRTLDRNGRELIRNYLARSGQVMVAMGPEVDLGTLSDVLGVKLPFAESPVKTAGATMIASDSRHPIFRPFLSPSGALGDVQVEEYRRLNDQPDRTVLARFSGGDTALAEQSVGKGRLLVFTSDLDNDWSRFPLNPAFVPFAVETARYLTHELSLSRGSAEGANSDAKSDESNPATTTAQDFTNAIERTSRSGSRSAKNAAHDMEDRQKWWQVGLVVMLIALAGEALVGRRTT